MYHTCIFCNHDLTSNDVIETLPIGRRIAFDPERGRLWVVCRVCERWNLTPFDLRWESIERCESLFRAERKKVASNNIGLAVLDEGLELVRIGKPGRYEFASWRYGDQFGRRRRRSIASGIVVTGIAGAFVAGAAIAGAIAGVGAAAFYFGRQQLSKRQSRQVVACTPTNDGEAVVILGEHLEAVRLKTDYETPSGWKLILPHAEGSTTVSGDHAMRALAVLLPTINGTGAGVRHVRQAIRRLETIQNPMDYLRAASSYSSHDARPGTMGAISTLPPDVRLAVEMAANEENERLAMSGEMWLLEWEWEQAEAIAAIADRLLVPTDVEEKFRELKRRTAQAQNPTTRTS